MLFRSVGEVRQSLHYRISIVINVLAGRVLAKLIVEKVDPHAPRKNIDNYRDAIVKGLPDFADYEVAIPNEAPPQTDE